MDTPSSAVIDPQLLLDSNTTLHTPCMAGPSDENHGFPITEESAPVCSPALTAPVRHDRGNAAKRNHEYSQMTLVELKALCKTLRVKVSGNKGELIRRLETIAPQVVYPPIELLPHGVSHTLPTPVPSPEVDTREVMEESAKLDSYFDVGHNNGTEVESESEEEGESDDEELRKNRDLARNVSTDKFILETRRKGGRQTESSVLKQWLDEWVPQAIKLGIIPDIIIDVPHIIEYLKYAATRQLLTTRGKKRTSSSRLSSSSLKKIVTMLGRERRRQEDKDPTIKVTRPAKSSRLDDFYKAVMVQAQRLRLESEDFDITEGTILDSQLRPEQFDEATAAIFKMDQITSIVKAFFSWTWQCSTLNRSDEVTSMLMSCLQPFDLSLPDYIDTNGSISPSRRAEFGILALFHETKVPRPGKMEPTYSFALPHRNPLRCPVGALAILLHYMFDQRQLVSQVPEWKWENSNSWRKFHVLFGKTVTQPFSGDSLGKMYAVFLGQTSIKSKKRTHLPRKTIPTQLEDAGVPADQVDAVGHWKGNTRREIYGSKIPKAASVALAGFPVGESYNVPWSKVQVPDTLQAQIFPFCEEALVNVRLSGCQNQGVINFLELLVRLRPFFWRAVASISVQFPNSGLIKRLNILSSNQSSSEFIAKWPALLREEELIRHQSLIVEQTFSEAPTRQAFSAVSLRLDEFQSFMDTTTSDLSVLKRRTEQFSPSKKNYTSPPPRPKSSHHTNCACENEVQLSANVVTPNQLALGSVQAPLPQTNDNHFLRLPLMAPCKPAPNLLIPYKVTLSNINYILLPLSLPASLNHPSPRTPHDLILPPPTAFRNSMYPQFTTLGCTWQHIFDHISNPADLWISYAPGSLGDFFDIKSLWQAWDEGTYVVNVGRKPALRLVDTRWGSIKNQDTNKGKLPSWRPRNNDNARKVWSKFYFFIQRIEEKIKTGHSADEAISYFDNLRGDQSLNQLHKSLQIKKTVSRS